MNEEMKKFEEALAELELLVKRLENDVPVDEATKAFEEGIKLSKICMDDLNGEKGKLELLMDDLNKITEEFKID